MQLHHQLKKKKICYVTTIPLTLKAFVFSQAMYLLENGWDVTFICAEDTNFYKDIPDGVKYIPMPFKRGMDPLGIPIAIFKLYQIFKREKFDILQYSTPNAAFYTATAAWFSRNPIRLYAQWGLRYVGFTGLRRILFKQIEKWCCFCSTTIEPDSFSNLQYSIKEGLYPANKGKVVWNGSACGIDICKFDINRKEEWRNEYRKKLGLEPNNVVIGYVGDLRRDKGCNELIAACRSLFNDMPLARLLLRSDKTFYTSIEKDLRGWVDASDQVINVPRNDEIPQYMACMDIFSLPSYREGCPMVVIEASSMGVPVVVSDVPGPIDVMRNGETGMVVPVKNPGALANALRELLNDKTKREQYGRSAANFARDHFEQKEFFKHVLRDKELLLLLNSNISR